MPGDAWQRFANLRAYYGWLFAFPGKKLLFMGNEFAQVASGTTTPVSTGICWRAATTGTTASSDWCAT